MYIFYCEQEQLISDNHNLIVLAALSDSMDFVLESVRLITPLRSMWHPIELLNVCIKRHVVYFCLVTQRTVIYTRMKPTSYTTTRAHVLIPPYIAICCSEGYQIVAIRFDGHTQNHLDKTNVVICTALLQISCLHWIAVIMMYLDLPQAMHNWVRFETSRKQPII